MLALRQFGLGLAAIQAWLAADSDLVALIRQHLGAFDREVRRFELLRHRLQRLLATWEDTDQVTTSDLLDVMEEMTMFDDYLDPGELSRLRTTAAGSTTRVSTCGGPKPSRRSWDEIRDVVPDSVNSA